MSDRRYGQPLGRRNGHALRDCVSKSRQTKYSTQPLGKIINLPETSHHSPRSASTTKLRAMTTVYSCSYHTMGEGDAQRLATVSRCASTDARMLRRDNNPPRASEASKPGPLAHFVRSEGGSLGFEYPPPPLSSTGMSDRRYGQPLGRRNRHALRDCASISRQTKYSTQPLGKIMNLPVTEPPLPSLRLND